MENEADQWEELIGKEIACMQKWLTQIRVELEKYPNRDGYNYLRPMKEMIYEALTQLYREHHKRVDEGDNLLKDIL